jgi:hypothetical protein
MSQAPAYTELVTSTIKTTEQKMEVVPLIDWDKHIVFIKKLDFPRPLFYTCKCSLAMHHVIISKLTEEETVKEIEPLFILCSKFTLQEPAVQRPLL